MLALAVFEFLQQMEECVPPPENQHHSLTRDGNHLVFTFRQPNDGSVCFFLSPEEIREENLEVIAKQLRIAMKAL